MKFNNIPCICCGTILNSDTFSNELEYTIDTKRKPISNGTWDSGSVDKISPGYGSSLDGDVFYMGICDDCILLKVNSGEIYYSHNYMGIKSDTSIWENAMKSKIREIEIDKIINK